VCVREGGGKNPLGGGGGGDLGNLSGATFNGNRGFVSLLGHHIGDVAKEYPFSRTRKKKDTTH